MTIFNGPAVTLITDSKGKVQNKFIQTLNFLKKGEGGAQWTNTGLDPQISKFDGQEWTGTDEE